MGMTLRTIINEIGGGTPGERRFKATSLCGCQSQGTWQSSDATVRITNMPVMDM
jgi:NADH:ubiquinone oxidoreductase subunit F (NADH-binding)